VETAVLALFLVLLDLQYNMPEAAVVAVTAE
jgi:hypothetical protein